MATNYTTKTAALRATKADINKLDAKKVLLNGKNILDYISDSEFDSYDTRDPQLKNDELDIWNTEISLSDNGHIEVKPLEHTYEQMTDEQEDLLFNNAAQVINNEVLDTDGNHLMYWQTDGLTCSYYWKDEDNDGYEDAHVSVFCHDSHVDESSSSNQSLTVFDSDLSNLTDGEYMFFYCSNLESFSSDLSSLINGDNMFSYCYNLESFNSDLSNLTNGGSMFSGTNLTSFSSNLSSLTYGRYMFSNTNLTTFSSDLSNLTYGGDMFNKCKLDAQSVANIIHFIPQRDAKPTEVYADGNITIGIGIANTEEAKQTFAEELDCVDWADLNKEFDDKNWAVVWQFNGEASTFDLRSPRPSTAVFARLEEVIMPTEEEIAEAKEKGERIQKPHYQYTSQDGSKFYNIHWYHDSNTNNEGYDYFESLEEAIAAYSVITK